MAPSLLRALGPATCIASALALADRGALSAQAPLPPASTFAVATIKDPPKPAPPPWLIFHADLGLVSTTGNTDVSTLNFADALTSYTSHSNKLGQTFAVTYGTQNRKVRTSLWTAGLRDEYKLSTDIGIYALGAFDRNTFAGIEQRFEEGGGGAITPVHSVQHHLEVDIGGSFIEQRTTAGVNDNFAAARGAFTYQYKFTKDAYVQEMFDDVSDLKQIKDYRLDSQSSLVAPLSKHIAIKVGYEVRYSNQPPTGFKTTDRLLTTDLQFNF